MLLYKNKFFWIILILFVIAVYFAMQHMTSAESTPYDILDKNGNFETRSYPNIVTVSVRITGSRNETLSKGFRILFHYIQGNNALNKKIRMTAPVLQKRIGKQWEISFILPAGFTILNSPQPNNKRISINNLAYSNYLVIRFSGNNSDQNINTHQKKLMGYMKKHNILHNREEILAYYNPPWVLPIFRRNEILYQLP